MHAGGIHEFAGVYVFMKYECSDFGVVSETPHMPCAGNFTARRIHTPESGTPAGAGPGSGHIHALDIGGANEQPRVEIDTVDISKQHVIVLIRVLPCRVESNQFARYRKCV